MAFSQIFGHFSQLHLGIICIMRFQPFIVSIRSLYHLDRNKIHFSVAQKKVFNMFSGLKCRKKYLIFFLRSEILGNPE